jgi:hypothetical protein
LLAAIRFGGFSTRSVAAGAAASAFWEKEKGGRKKQEKGVSRKKGSRRKKGGKRGQVRFSVEELVSLK